MTCGGGASATAGSFDRVRIVSIASGHSVVVEARATDSVDCIKARLLQEGAARAAATSVISGSPAELEGQRLIFEGQELAEGRATLASCGVAAPPPGGAAAAQASGMPAIYHLVRGGPAEGGDSQGLQRLARGAEGLVVKTLTGQALVVEARGAETVAALKARLRERLARAPMLPPARGAPRTVAAEAAAPPPRMRLIFEGAELHDGDVLGDRGIVTRAGGVGEGASALYLVTPGEHAGGAELPPQQEAPRRGVEAPSDLAPRAAPAPAQDRPWRQGEALPGVGCIVERELDGIWFQARVLRCSCCGAQLDLQYLDDGKVEAGVVLRDCRPPASEP